MCVSILYWCFSFWLTSLCIIGSGFVHLIRTDSNVLTNDLDEEIENPLMRFTDEIEMKNKKCEEVG